MIRSTRHDIPKQKEHRDGTVYIVDFGGKSGCYGSIAAIYDRYSYAELGIARSTLYLWLRKHPGDVYDNGKCRIKKTVIYRRKTLRAWWK